MSGHFNAKETTTQKSILMRFCRFWNVGCDVCTNYFEVMVSLSLALLTHVTYV